MLWFLFGIIIIIVGLVVAYFGIIIGVVVLAFAAVIKGIEQAYYWYIGEPFEIIWIIGGVIALLLVIVGMLSENKEK